MVHLFIINCKKWLKSKFLSKNLINCSEGWFEAVVCLTYIHLNYDCIYYSGQIYLLVTCYVQYKPLLQRKSQSDIVHLHSETLLTSLIYRFQLNIWKLYLFSFYYSSYNLKVFLHVSSSTMQYNLSAPHTVHTTRRNCYKALCGRRASSKTVQRFFLRVNKYYSGLFIICETICCVYKLCLLWHSRLIQFLGGSVV